MSEKQQNEFKSSKKKEILSEISRVDERRFSQQLEGLVIEAEEMRVKRMSQHRARGFVAMTFSILAAFTGSAAFGWFFLMQLDVRRALICVVVPFFISVLVYMWAAMPIRVYKREHKAVFMPKLAKALSGLNYFKNREINKKIIDHAAVLPVHNRFHSEDCFMGTYKGVKVIFSEARLYAAGKKHEPVFQGIFVLLETAGDVIEGHTIITANAKLAQSNLKTRWKAMKQVFVTPSNPEWDIFQVYSTRPDAAELIVGDRLLKELTEASMIFDKAPLTAVLFGKRFVFMMIPNDKDMFEASNLYIPIATHQYALNCRKEIEQILEIIDIFDLYQPLKS